MDGAVEIKDIGEGAVGEIVLLEIAPAPLDVVEFEGIFRQPFDPEPRSLVQGRVVALLVWIGPWSRTTTKGWGRSVVP